MKTRRVLGWALLVAALLIYPASSASAALPSVDGVVSIALDPSSGSGSDPLLTVWDSTGCGSDAVGRRLLSDHDFDWSGSLSATPTIENSAALFVSDSLAAGVVTLTALCVDASDVPVASSELLVYVASDGSWSTSSDGGLAFASSTWDVGVTGVGSSLVLAAALPTFALLALARFTRRTGIETA